MLRSRPRSWLLAAVLALLTACATPPRPAPAEAGTAWSGRLALQVQDKPGESFSAGFELSGDAKAGELTLTSPLGASMAVLSWKPGAATLHSGGRVEQFGSLDELVAKATGSPIPVAALFDWLRGVDTPVHGWRADLSQLHEGRLVAQRSEPPPRADLRVVLER